MTVLVDKVVKARELGNDDHENAGKRDRETRDKPPSAGHVFPKVDPSEDHKRHVDNIREKENIQHREDHEIRHDLSSHVSRRRTAVVNVSEEFCQEHDSRERVEGRHRNDDLLEAFIGRRYQSRYETEKRLEQQKRHKNRLCV